jgi:hypothetical protein
MGTTYSFLGDDGSDVGMSCKGINNTYECHGHMTMYFCYTNKNTDFFPWKINQAANGINDKSHF